MRMNRRSVTAVLCCVAVGVTAAVFIRSAQSGTPAVSPALAATEPAGGIALFASAQRPADLPAAAAAAAVAGRLSGDGQSVPEGWKPGSAVAGTARVALSRGDLTIWAYRTTKGRVCEGLANGGITQSAGCTDGWSDRLPVDVNTDSLPTGQQVVWGLTPDAVKAVSVIVNGEEAPAQLGRNAYLFEGVGSITGIVATRADGSVERFTFGASPSPIP